MDKYFMWIHYERLHNHNKAKHNKTVCIFLGIYCILPAISFDSVSPQDSLHSACLATSREWCTLFTTYLHQGKQPMMTSSNLMETFSALLAICAVTGEFPSQRPVTRRFDVSFDLRPNERLSKQSWGWWVETPSRPLWRHNNKSSRLEYCIQVNARERQALSHKTQWMLWSWTGHIVHNRPIKNDKPTFANKHFLSARWIIEVAMRLNDVPCQSSAKTIQQVNYSGL